MPIIKDALPGQYRFSSGSAESTVAISIFQQHVETTGDPDGLPDEFKIIANQWQPKQPNHLICRREALINMRPVLHQQHYESEIVVSALLDRATIGLASDEAA